MHDIAVIILTRNEQLHLERCIRSLPACASQVFVVDCGSDDATVEIARSLGATVVHHDWVNYASQLNWAIRNCPITADWVMRLDADEYLTSGLAEELDARLADLDEGVTGVNFRRCVRFMGRSLRHGSLYPIVLLRLWRRGFGRCEQRWMDEHIILDRGETVTFDHDLIDENLKSLTWWIDKHNRYATREAIDVLIARYQLTAQEKLRSTSRHAYRQRWLKQRVYYKMPPTLRTWSYFVYRYVVRAGFLDGYPGLVFHTIQGLWYRLLVDAKVREVERRMQREGIDACEAIRRLHGITLRPGEQPASPAVHARAC